VDITASTPGILIVADQPGDVSERKLTLREPKSGRIEVPCMKPQ
jgi:hypothetical protein